MDESAVRRRRAPLVCVLIALIAPSPAAAFDCKLARSEAEKAICRDPAAQVADADMAKAFGALFSSLDPSRRPALATAQRRWLVRRDGDCAGTQGSAFAACLAAASARRQAFLTGAPLAGPGAPDKLVPSLVVEPGGKGRTDVDIEVLRFARPVTAAERAFNAAVDGLSSDVPQPDKDDPQADNYAYAWTMRLAYASPRLISAHAEGYSSTGGAYPTLSSADINIDVRAGRAATFSSLLDKSAAQKVFALCTGQVAAEKRSREGEEARLDAEALEQLRQSVATTTGALGAWSFGADAATISYAADAVGVHAEGAFSCEMPYAALRPLVKPDFPLP